MMSPYGSTNDHGQCTELERPAAPDPIGDGAAEQAPNKGSAQADAHHESFSECVAGEAEVGRDALQGLVDHPASPQPRHQTSTSLR